MNYRAEYLGQMLFCSKVIVRRDTQLPIAQHGHYKLISNNEASTNCIFGISFVCSSIIRSVATKNLW